MLGGAAVTDDLDEVDRDALAAMFPRWGAQIDATAADEWRDTYAPDNDTRCMVMPGPAKMEVGEELPASWFQQSNGGVRRWTTVSGELDVRMTTDAEARDWLNEKIDRECEAAFLEAFPARTDVTPHDRIVCGAFAIWLRERAWQEPDITREIESAIHERDIRAEAARRQSIAEKAAHVRRATQTREHGCHWPGCRRQCKPAMWGCREHWFELPQFLRDKIWRSYRVGQETTRTPSREYVAVMREVEEWILEHVIGDVPLDADDWDPDPNVGDR